MLSLFKKSDEEVQKDVLSELREDPSLGSELIAVNAIDGVVILQGTVVHFLDRKKAKDAAMRVSGVREVIDGLKVNLSESLARTDGDIVKAALISLEWNYKIPKGIEVEVRKGFVTLKGETEWHYQRNLAEKIVSQLMGVAGVYNHLTIRTIARPDDIKVRIENALTRAAKNDGRRIKVSVEGGKVVLTGEVSSFSEVQDARLAAWSAQGVMAVENNLNFLH